MQLFKCCCGWSFIIGKKQVYGPIFPIGIGDYPTSLSNGQHMMTRETFDMEYGDCSACAMGHHHHPR